MKIYILMLKAGSELKNYLPSSCYINKNNAIYIQNKMRETFDTDYELKEMSICDSTFINQDVDPSKYKWNQA